MDEATPKTDVDKAQTDSRTAADLVAHSLPPHAVNGRSLFEPWPQGFEMATFAMGCFWGVERLFWQTKGVWVTMVGYAGGHDTNPNYYNVCAGNTGHTEAIRLVYDPSVISYEALLQMFWENHDPTQGMRQGNDVGTQYRSAIFANDDQQLRLAETSKQQYQSRLTENQMGGITTQIVAAVPFYYAEEDHQQYLAKTPGGYCNMKGTGVSCV